MKSLVSLLAGRAFALCVFLTMSSLATAADYSAVRGYVNDFANVIPSDRAAVLEQKLRAYEQETSVEMVVVTTPSLDGESVEQWSIGLAEAWKIGKKDKDNGLIIVIAPTERKSRIEVGYGLEGNVPDAVASRLLRDEALKNAFRSGDFASGIDWLADSLITAIGHQSAAERAKALAEKREAEAALEQRAIENLKDTGMFFGGLLLILAVLAGIGRLIKRIRRSIREWSRKRKLRKEIPIALAQLESKMSRIIQWFTEIDRKRFPKWVSVEAAAAQSIITKAAAAVSPLKKRILSALDRDPDLSAELLGEGELYFRQAQLGLDQMQSIGEKVKQYRLRAEQGVTHARIAATATLALADDLKREGYRLASSASESTLKTITTDSATLQTMLAARKEGVSDNSDEILQAAERLTEKAQKVGTSLKQLVENRAHVDRKIPELATRLNSLEAAIAPAAETLAGMRDSSPERVWRNFNHYLGEMGELVSRLHVLLDKASAKNSMESQDFAGAKRDVYTVEASLKAAEDKLHEIAKRKNEVDQAKEIYPKKLQTAEAALRDAKGKIRGAEPTVARKLAEAEGTLAKAKEVAEASLPDWLLAVELLAMAVVLASEATKEVEASSRRIGRSAAKTAPAASNAADDGEVWVSSNASAHSTPDPDPVSLPGGDGSFGGGGASGDW